MSSDTLDRVAMVLAESGNTYTSLVANQLVSDRYNTPAEAGAVNGKSYWWMIEQDLDYVIFEGVWTLTGTLVAIGTIWHSKIAGVHGTAKITLVTGSSTLRSVTPAEMLRIVMLRADRAQSFTNAEKAQLLVNAGTREVLYADRTYYVRTDGSDSNNGLANTSGGGFLTMQKAVDTVVKTLDVNGFTVTVQIADGTYTENVIVSSGVGIIAPANFVIKGNTSTPHNVIAKASSGNIFLAQYNALVQIQDMEIGTGVSASCFRAENGGQLNFSNIRFASSGSHVITIVGGRVRAVGNFEIIANFAQHANATGSGGSYRVDGVNITITGSLTTSASFLSASRSALIDWLVPTISGSGSVTGTRTSVSSNGVIFLNGGAESSIPGSSNGTPTTGGQVV